MQVEFDRLISCPSACGDEHYVADAMETAALWHGGQSSALYAFMSTGSVLPGLAREARTCADYAAQLPPEGRAREGLTDDDMDAVNIMADICDALEAELPEQDA